jgi:uridine kinase
VCHDTQIQYLDSPKYSADIDQTFLSLANSDFVNSQELVKILTERILAQPAKASGAKIIAIGGWAGTGKSTISRRICEAIQAHGLTSNCLSTDSFLVERTLRKARGVTGYNPSSSDNIGMKSAIVAISRGASFEYQVYDSETGRPSGPFKVFDAADVVLIEGVRSFDSMIQPFVDLSLAICASTDDMFSLRITANLEKCRLDMTEATRWLELERQEFDQFVAPNIARADIVVCVDAEYEYSLHQSISNH